MILTKVLRLSLVYERKDKIPPLHKYADQVFLFVGNDVAERLSIHLHKLYPCVSFIYILKREPSVFKQRR